MDKIVRIGSRLVGEGQPCFIIAEMSGNHNMDFERAKQLLYAAKEAGAEAVKIQTYTADTITLNSDNPEFLAHGLWEGQTLYELYQKAYTPWEWQPELNKLAHELGLILFSSPFDETSVDFLEKMDVPAYKIASFEIGDIGLIRKVASTGKPVLISTGIASLADIELALETCRQAGNEQIILLKCTSQYPSPYLGMNIRSIEKLRETFGCLTGLSDHSMGDEVAIASVVLGADVVEKHFTLKRSDGGVDAAFSMEKDELKEMVTRIRHVEEAIGSAGTPLMEVQKANPAEGRSLYVSQEIKKGEKFTSQNVKSVRPGHGLHTKYLDEILGKRAANDIPYASPLRIEDIEWK